MPSPFHTLFENDYKSLLFDLFSVTSLIKTAGGLAILARLILLFYISLSAKNFKFALNFRIYFVEFFYDFDRHISRSKTANLFAVFFKDESK